MHPPSTGRFPHPLTPEDVFYRAVRPEDLLNNGMLSPQAFSQASATRKLSVDWGGMCSPQETYDRWPHWGAGRAVASLTAQQCWDCQQQIEYSPTPGNPAHSDVFDQQGRTIGRDKIRRMLARGAFLVVPPQP